MGKTLTISIAAYNVAGYINKALDSLIDEEIIDDLEILVVDDGGTDKTMEIARKYADRYPQSIFCIHKKNGGYGSTINTSIKLATGKYFKQLDGDDWFVKENLKDFIHVLKNTSADVILTDSLKYFEPDNSFSKGLDYKHIAEGEHDIENSGLDTRFSMHTVTFKTVLLKEYEQPLTEHCLYTDCEYISYPLLYVNTIYIYHKNIYVYRIGREEQSFNRNNIIKHYKEMEQVFCNCLKVYEQIDVSCEVKRRVMTGILCARVKDLFNFYLILPMSFKTLNELKKFYQKVKRECPGVLNQAKKESNTINLLVSSHFLLYPFGCFWTSRKWGRPN